MLSVTDLHWWTGGEEMGSRVMHAMIANQIASRVAVQDRPAFLLGAIAPDAVSPKERSHFFIGKSEEYTRALDFRGFLQKYQSLRDSSYILGYYTHLIADHIWLTGFYLPWLRNRLKNDQELLARYHHDFRLCNAKLCEYYGSLDLDMSAVERIPDLEEVSSEQVRVFLPHLLKDLEFDKVDAGKPLEVFTFEQILGYVETCVEQGVAELNLPPGRPRN